MIDDKLPPPPSYQDENPPPVPPRQQLPVHIEDVQHPSQSQISLGDSGYLPDSEPHRHQAQQQQLPDYSIYDDPTKYQRDTGVPPLLMPIRNGVLESYLNPFLTILHEIPSFRKAVYHYEFETLGFHPRWYRGEPVNIPDGTTIKVKDGETHDLRFLLEVQREFAFLDGDSGRFFSAINNFIRAFPRNAQKDFAAIDNIYEAYAVFYKTLADQLEVVGVENPLKIFESSLEDTTSQEVRAFGMFHFEAEELKRDLYSTIHSLIWGEDLENTQILTSLSDVITLAFEPSYDESINPVGVEIPEKFYPQIYGHDFKETIDELIKERQNLDKERRTISKELMNLRAYNGKHVSSILNTSIEFLSSELENSKEDTALEEALKDLEGIKNDNQDKITSLTDKQTHLMDTKAQVNPYDINVILKRYGSVPEPYLLTGVILSNNEFFFLRKTSDLIDLDQSQTQWVHAFYEPRFANDLRVAATDFSSIKRSVYAKTQTPYETSIVLIYTKESTWTTEADYEVPESVKTFISKDKLELEKTLELLASSTDEELSDEQDADGEVDDSDVSDEGQIQLEDKEEEGDQEDKENIQPNKESV